VMQLLPIPVNDVQRISKLETKPNAGAKIMSIKRSSEPPLERTEMAHLFRVPMTTEELIRDPIMDSVRVNVIDSIDPLATVGHDLGAASGWRRVEGVTILLKRSDDHEVALHTLLGELRNPSSSCYCRRLAREDIAALFGLAEKDLEKIVSWLRSHFLDSIRVSPGRTAVNFAGTLRNIETAFRTQFRRYRVEGREYLANAYECSVPAAFSIVVSGLSNLSFLTRDVPSKREAVSPRKFHKVSNAVRRASMNL